MIIPQMNRRRMRKQARHQQSMNLKIQEERPQTVHLLIYQPARRQQAWGMQRHYQNNRNYGSRNWRVTN